MARDNHQFAKFNKIGLDEVSNASHVDLHLAMAAGSDDIWDLFRALAKALTVTVKDVESAGGCNGTS